MNVQPSSGRKRGSSPFDPPWKGFLLGLPTAVIVLVVYLGLPHMARGFGDPIKTIVGLFLALDVLQLVVLAATRRFARTEEQLRLRKGMFLFNLGTLTGTVIGFLIALAIG